ncbi:High mobility group [Macleaya cordata]|uniref:HMG-Y-related protein A n=1 Tax=Macleaya cordata TaxID=56857 RepID=A0A200PU11_MACCD|nr:High mobility group [Macleaya cordata]
MATEEVNKPPTLPQYPEMIFAAISALDEKNGCNKSSIAKYIESQYGDLPPGHTTLLSHHLNKLKDSGELILVKNNYMRPNPDAPPKRGRGRPPKPKTSMPEDATVVGPPRPRGRPPKAKDPSLVAEKRKVSEPTGRPRGRPKKVRTDDEAEDQIPEAVVPAALAPKVTGPPRPRGRPPKVKAPFGAVGFE